MGKFEELLESGGFDDESKTQIKEAWDSRLTEAKEEITAELREEFSQRFEHDKGVLVGAMDTFLNENIKAEITEFAEDRKSLVETKVEYKKSIKEHAQKLEKFMTKQIAEEIKEFHTDRKAMKENVGKLEGFVLQQLSEEIKEFHKDKQELVEQRVKLVRQGKKELAEAKKSFIKKASKLVESNINTILRSEITQYRDDINEARQNDFGKRMFEAFVGEYMTSYLNENSEVKKLQKVMSAKDKKLSEAVKALEEQKKLTESTASKVNVMKDRMNRDKVKADLMSPLSKEKRDIMNDLLTTVKTEKLKEAFNKYLPAVLSETSVKKKNKKSSLTETQSRKEKTGDRESITEAEGKEAIIELGRIKNLAGL